MDAAFGLLVLAMVVILSLGLLTVWAFRRRKSLRLRPEDAAELEALGRGVLAEHHRQVAMRLQRVLETLRRRRVPLSRVQPVPGVRGQGILVFQDGTSIVARSTRPGDLGLVAVAALQGRVLLTAAEDNGSEVEIVLGWGSGGARALEAVAVDAEPLSG